MLDARIPLLPLLLDGVPEGLRQAIAQEGIACADHVPGSAAGQFVLFDSRSGTSPQLVRGQTAIDVDRLRGGKSDPFEDLLDERAARHRWRLGGFQVAEEIARVDKRAVRAAILGRLRRIVEESGGIWLRLSAFPFPYRSAFNFRIDHDDYDPHDFAATLQACAGHEDATSHFVCAADFEANPEALARLRGLDVGAHGYWHHTYREAQDNLENIRRGIAVLAAAGIEPSGFVAPHGRFNRGLLTALETLGISHSSEFALAYDELPFLPISSSVLQIPIHPVCLGLFLEAAREAPAGEATDPRAAVAAAAEHFDHLARAKYAAGEPIFLYGHPTGRIGRYPQVLGTVFQTISSFGAVWKTTFTQFAAWWRARAQVRLAVFREGTHFEVVVRGAPAGYRLAAEYWQGACVAPMPLDNPVVRFSATALAYQKRKGEAVFRPVRIDRAQGLRERVRRYLDWERVTPVEELRGDTWRGWMKRALRRIRR